MFEDPDLAGLSDRARQVLPTDMRHFRHLPYAFEVADDVVRTRENALMLSFEVMGIDGLTSASSRIEVLRDQIARLLAGLDDQHAFYVHRLSRPADLKLPRILGSSFAADVDRSWSEHLAGQGLREFVTIITVVRTMASEIRVPFLRKTAARLFQADTVTRLAGLREVSDILKTAIQRPTRDLLVSDGSLLGFYAALSSGILTRIKRGTASLIAEDVGTSALAFDTGTVEVIDGFGDRRFAAVLYVGQHALSTMAGMLDGIDEGANSIVTHSYVPIDRTTVSERALRKLAQMQATAEIASIIERQLVDTVDEVKAGLAGFGDHQMTVTIFAESRTKLEADISRIRGVALQAGVRLAVERLAAEATFFACHPGNLDYRCRKSTISSTNFTDLAALHLPDPGESAERLPWRMPMTIFETAQGTPHKFSFHEPGDPEAEPTVGHSLVLGPSGSGKTGTIAFLATQALRARARVIIFDKDRGLEMAVSAMGGRYATIRAGQGTGLSPLQTEGGDRGRAFLVDWLASLMERDGTILTPAQSNLLKNAIRQNNEATASLRTFDQFATLFGDAGDDRALAAKIGEWTPEGRYGWVFGPADKPVVDFSDAVTALDLTELLDLTTERTAILSYLFRRIELLMEERRPTLLIIDEAWKVLDDAYFAGRLKQWLVTARKLNVIVVMMTQFPSQILQSRARAIFEGLPNQLIFPNAAAEPDDYAQFSLTENEMEFVLRGALARRVVLWRTNRGSTILDVDLRALGPLMTALGGGQAGIRAFGADFTTRASFWKEQSHEII